MGLFSRREQRTPAPSERRDPTAATAQLRYLGRGQAQVPDWNPESAIRLGFYANIVAYRCGVLIADTIAGRPFRAGTAPPEKPGGTAEHNPQARLAQLLGPPPGGPNPEMSARRLWAYSITSRVATGRYGWEIETDGDRVVALWPLVSSYLKAIPSEGGARYFSGFEYGRPDDLRRFPPERVHYGWTMSQTDVRQAHSPLQVARYEMAVALATQKHNYAFLSNGAVPATIVGVEAFASRDEFEAWKRQWGGEYGGPDNAGKTHFVELEPGDDATKLSEALFVQTIGQSARDGRIPEQHLTALQHIAISLGVPWSKLDASGRTFDNAAAEDRSFWESTLLQAAADMADDVNIKLAPRLGPEVGWFDLSDVEALQPRPPASAGEIPALIAAGVVTPDEARPWLGLSGPAPEMATPDVGGGAPPPSGEAEPQPPARSWDWLAPALEVNRRARAEVEQLATADQEPRRRRIWAAHDTVVAAHERAWERRFRRLFDRQAASALARLEGRSRAKRWRSLAEARGPEREVREGARDIFDPAFWLGETTEVATDLFEQLASSAFARLSERFGISFDLESEFAVLFITRRANQLAGQVTETTYRAITAQLAEGVAAGESIPDLAARVRTVFSDASQVRATTIARTEVISGHNAAASAAAAQLPADVVAGQQWIATRDGRVRPEHAAADGQIVAVGQPFDVDGAAMLYPGDPNGPPDLTVNCRCAVAFLTPEEFAAEASLFAQAQATQPVPLERASAILRLVRPGEALDEVRFARALAVAA